MRRTTHQRTFQVRWVDAILMATVTVLSGTLTGVLLHIWSERLG